jgi:hypothetical protein
MFEDWSNKSYAVKIRLRAREYDWIERQTILLNCFIADQIELDSVNKRDLLTEKVCRAIELLCTVVSWFCWES